MKNKIVLIVVILVLIIGASLVFWRQKQNQCNPSVDGCPWAPAVQKYNNPCGPLGNCAPYETQAMPQIELVLGGNFQTTKYNIKNSILTYFHSDEKGEQSSTSTITSTDLANLNSLFSKYNLDALHSDPTPGPDMSNYYLVIVKDGEKYQLQFVSSQNPGYTLASELEKFLNQTIKKKMIEELSTKQQKDDLEQNDYGPLLGKEITTRELASKVNTLVSEATFSIESTAMDAIKLHMYNYLVNFPNASRSLFDLELEKINKLSEVENLASYLDNPLPTVGIEIENSKVDIKLTNLIKFLGVNTPHSEEVSPNFSYSAKTQARILMELVNIGFIPTKVGLLDGVARIPKDRRGDFSMHLNFGFPADVEAFNMTVLRKQAPIISDVFAYAFASPYRLANRKTAEAVKIKDDALPSTKNLGGQHNRNFRLEIRPGEFQDYTSFRMLLEAQRIVAMYFSFLKIKQDIPVSEKERQVAILWNTFRDDVTQIRSKYILSPNAIDADSRKADDAIETLKTTGLKKECRDLITKYSLAVEKVLA